MKFIDLPAPRQLMQSVNVLCDHCFQFSRLLQLRQFDMRRIRFCIQLQHFILIKPIEFFGISHEKLWLNIVSGG